MSSGNFLPRAALLAAVCFVHLSAAGEPAYRWESDEHHLALVDGERVVWRFNAGPDDAKPCFHPLTLPDGTELTCFRPDDHPWHRAAWFCLKIIDRVNYWEEDRETGLPEGRTVVRAKRFEPRADFSATIELDIDYPPSADAPAALSERRTIEISAPDADGGYSIASTHRFKAAKDVVLNRNFYGGFSLRCKRQPGPWECTWSLVDSAGRLLEQKPQADGKPGPFPETDAPWVAFVEKPSGSTRGIAVFNHPGNPEEPFKWCVLPFMPFLSPSATGKADLPLRAGEELALRYGIVVFDNRDPAGHLPPLFNNLFHAEE